jgi:hypothetical protein
MDISNLAPDIANLLGVQPSTMLLLLFLLTTAANVVSRLIPDTATGGLLLLKQICSIVGAHVSNRIAPGVTQADVAKAALDTPPIDEKAEAIAEAK